jgi:NADPH2:quinone reductase
MISLPAATLRSSAIELLGSGFGSASLDQIVQAVAEFFKVAATQPFHFKAKAVSLKDVEALWNAPESGVRLVFQP